MCGAVALSEEEGLQPFTVPSGWMGSASPPPVQAYTQDEIEAEVRRTEPALKALYRAAEERAPSLLSRFAILPLARLAAWTSGQWVRPLEEWPGFDAKDGKDGEGDDDEDDESGDGDAVSAAWEGGAAVIFV